MIIVTQLYYSNSSIYVVIVIIFFISSPNSHSSILCTSIYQYPGNETEWFRTESIIKLDNCNWFFLIEDNWISTFILNIHLHLAFKINTTYVDYMMQSSSTMENRRFWKDSWTISVEILLLAGNCVFVLCTHNITIIDGINRCHLILEVFLQIRFVQKKAVSQVLFILHHHIKLGKVWLLIPILYFLLI